MEIAVAGHICLDLIPAFEGREGVAQRLLEPGKLVEVGTALRATGGAVSNTGLALHRLGVPVSLLGKVGDDLFGEEILRLLNALDPRLADKMIVVGGETTSYTVVISPPGVDRTLLHCPGANDTFRYGDVDFESIAGAKIFHFGYPPIMKHFYWDGGLELRTLLKRAASAGMVTSLDMALPDPESVAGRADWRSVLERCASVVDFFMPSLEELLFMVDVEFFDQLSARHGDLLDAIDGHLLNRLAGQVLEWGGAVVGIKLGDKGLYLRTTGDRKRLKQLTGRLGLDAERWTGRELLAPCFEADVVGTTGSGDCTIAGFLAALVGEAAAKASPEAAITLATAVGACSVEQPDATSGVPAIDEVQARLDRGWPRLDRAISLDGWRPADESGIFSAGR